MARSIAVLISVALVSVFTSIALGQSDDELREMYFRRDYARIEAVAQTGDERAEAWMGLIHNNYGRREEAKVWYRRAAEKGNLWAIGRLASAHRVDKEREEALYWYRRGAELGHRDSQTTLAWLLLEGDGYPKDEREAFRLYSAAVARGHRGAYLVLANLHADGRGTERNAIEAYALAEVAETVLDTLSDGDRVQTAKALKARLGQELQPDGIAQAVVRAREIRPDLDRIRAGREHDRFVLQVFVGVVLIVGVVCILVTGWFLVRLARPRSHGA